jgi:integrase
VDAANREIDRREEAAAAQESAPVHDLRHTSASWLIDAGASPLEIKNRLGHKSITTTYNVYGHIFDKRDSDGKITAAFDRILGDGTPALKLVK